MPVAYFRDLKERTEAAAEGARGSAANAVRRKTKSPHPGQIKRFKEKRLIKES